MAERRQGDGVGSLKSCKTMKEAYAVRRTVLGARLIIQRAVEDEFDAWLGRAR